MKKALFAVPWIFVACGGPSQTDGTQVVTLGAALDITGPISASTSIGATRLAIVHANDGLEKTSSKLRFKIDVRDAPTPTLAEQTAKELIQTGGAKGLVVDNSTNVVAVTKLAYDSDTSNDLNVPVTCFTCTSTRQNNPATTDADPVLQETYRNTQGWVFRSVLSTDPVNSILVKVFLATNNGDVNSDGKFKIALYSSDAAAFQPAVNGMIALITAANPSVVIERTTIPATANVNTYDFNGDMTKLTNNFNEGTSTTDGFPDYILSMNYAPTTVGAVRAYVFTNQTTRMFLWLARGAGIQLALGSLINGIEGTSPVMADPQYSGNAFIEATMAYQGKKPMFPDGHAYDSAAVLVLATMVATKDMANPSEVTGAQIRDGLKKISDPAGVAIGIGPDEIVKAFEAIKSGQAINYTGVSGPMDYDEFGNVRHRMAHFKGVNADFVDENLYDCVSSSLCPLSQQ